jgi:hypothetical protein
MFYSFGFDIWNVVAKDGLLRYCIVEWVSLNKKTGCICKED